MNSRRRYLLILLLTFNGGYTISKNPQSGNQTAISETHSRNESVYHLTTTAGEFTLDEWELECYAEKHESYCNCSSQHVVLDRMDYQNTSGVLNVTKLNVVLNSSFYEIDSDGEIIVCSTHLTSPTEVDKNLEPLSYISVIGLALSMTAMMIHLVAFLLIRDFKNMPGCNLACLCFSMLSGYASFLVGTLETIQSLFEMCVASAFTTQFFLLSSLMWMNVISFGVFRSVLSSTTNLRLGSSAFSVKKFLLSCLYSWGTSFAIASVTLTVDNAVFISEKLRPLFGKEKCWFNQLTSIWVFFIAPVFTSIIVNVIFFACSAYIIFSNRIKTDHCRRGRLKENFLLYTKLALVTGMLWIFAVLARSTDHVVFWYFFALTNSLQGFFIFLAFTLTPKARKYITQKISSSLRTRSSVVCSPTITAVTVTSTYGENKV